MKYILFILISTCVVSSGKSALEDKITRSMIHTDYEVRRYMTKCFEDCKNYINEIDDYIQKIEAARFKESSKKHAAKFRLHYKEFYGEFKKLRTTYEAYKFDESDPLFRSKFRENLTVFDKTFRKASSTYSRSFRSVTKSLTKLDESKMAYMDTEVYKKCEKATLITTHRLRAIEQMVKILEIRGDECGPLSNREQFHKDATDKINRLRDESKKAIDEFPVTVVNEEQYNKLGEVEERVKTLFETGIKTLEEFDENLRKMYESKGGKYNDDFRKLIKFFERIPFRLSSFVTPNTLGSMIIVAFLLMNF
ncbi:putative integral membrane protein [Theileria parva strain Muguga]|uniref:Uncharacterized protein n=1 Tax=Theileria parva TaxID=5875 RepID=Q4N781_THEPA|nr:putative integral membrane protein [Theileria parva strain Muguga]EAN34177.1 putative integral membrane protein [Theileria parva strain Muguga]|eukprot:XP_766460.1 hypothetical protein [Theileria parva strain Muguga]